MKLSIKRLSSVLLLLNGIGAIFGGWSLITRPDGNGLGMPLEMLRYSPFPDFLIPGIILFTVIGLFSLAIFILILRGVKSYPRAVFVEGVLLIGWIVIEVVFLRAVAALHIIYFVAGVLMMALGYAGFRVARSE